MPVPSCPCFGRSRVCRAARHSVAMIAELADVGRESPRMAPPRPRSPSRLRPGNVAIGFLARFRRRDWTVRDGRLCNRRLGRIREAEIGVARRSGHQRERRDQEYLAHCDLLWPGEPVGPSDEADALHNPSNQAFTLFRGLQAPRLFAAAACSRGNSAALRTTAFS